MLRRVPSKHAAMLTPWLLPLTLPERLSALTARALFGRLLERHRNFVEGMRWWDAVRVALRIERAYRTAWWERL